MNVRREPPGECAEVTSLVTVVLAPHYDDEVLGCGGLVARLARGGTRVHVVFLTDGSGGIEEVGDRAAYASRRRAESVDAIRALGIASSDHLGLPDGSLLSSLDRLRPALERVLTTERPDLLLVPSPLELTGDHRAAFAAAPPGAHRAARRRRVVRRHRGAARARLRGEPRRPSRSAGRRVARARRDRERDVALSKPARATRLSRGGARPAPLAVPDAGAAGRAGRGLPQPARRRLPHPDPRPADHRARRRARARPGDAKGRWSRSWCAPRTARRCSPKRSRSLAASTYRRLEVVLVNDGGAQPLPPDGFALPLVRVELDSNRGRAAAANAGVAAARGHYVLFLDDDDLIAPEHVETLVTLAPDQRRARGVHRRRGRDLRARRASRAGSSAPGACPTAATSTPTSCSSTTTSRSTPCWSSAASTRRWARSTRRSSSSRTGIS